MLYGCRGIFFPFNRCIGNTLRLRSWTWIKYRRQKIQEIWNRRRGTMLSQHVTKENISFRQVKTLTQEPGEDLFDWDWELFLCLQARRDCFRLILTTWYLHFYYYIILKHIKRKRGERERKNTRELKLLDTLFITSDFLLFIHC